MIHPGSCHCGNLKLEFETGLALAELPLRACQCSFCRLHGIVSTSDPQGRVRLYAGDPSLVQRYRFGLGITDFLICRRCGVYLAAVAEMDGARYAVLNANALSGLAGLGRAAEPMDYDGEDATARRARRRTRWTPAIGLESL